jgi:hypothetical protein
MLDMKRIMNSVLAHARLVTLADMYLYCQQVETIFNDRVFIIFKS